VASERLSGVQQVMSDDKLDHIRQGPEGRTDPTASSQGEIIRRLLASETRLGKLEAWVEVAMRTLATLGLEGLLIELDGARGANYGAGYDDRRALAPTPGE
jgi:hypothetical protein